MFDDEDLKNSPHYKHMDDKEGNRTLGWGVLGAVILVLAIVLIKMVTNHG